MEVVDQTQVEKKRVETSTQVEMSKANKLLHDARDNVGAPTSKFRQRRSQDWYTDYMALMSELLEAEPSSFKKDVEKIV